ncbi:MAG: thermonuclease family protein [Anaerolineae bacterium]|nr:thermonuclease family protein [Anaerolineae bacterium]
MKKRWLLLIIIMLLAACNKNGDEKNDESNDTSNIPVEAVENLPVRPENLTTVTVTHVVDGDTVDLADGTRIRLIGINTPELDQPYYDEATQFTRALLENKQVGLEFDADELDQYDRTLAYLWIGDELANYTIVRSGWANSLSIQPNVKYAVYIEQAQEKAAAEGAGIWQQSQATVAIDFVQYDPQGPDEENMNDEYVRLYNNGTVEINIAGFTVSDESRRVYTFGDLTLLPNGRVTLHSGCGVDTPPSQVFWCADDPVWNNSGDTVYVYDTEGRLVVREVVSGR